jgi:hypothetical protein
MGRIAPCTHENNAQCTAVVSAALAAPAPAALRPTSAPRITAKEPHSTSAGAGPGAVVYRTHAALVLLTPALSSAMHAGRNMLPGCGMT